MPNNENEQFDEQPTRAASAGSQESVENGRSGWQQPAQGLGEQFAAHGGQVDERSESQTQQFEARSPQQQYGAQAAQTAGASGSPSSADASGAVNSASTPGAISGQEPSPQAWSQTGQGQGGYSPAYGAQPSNGAPNGQYGQNGFGHQGYAQAQPGQSGWNQQGYGQQANGQGSYGQGQTGHQQAPYGQGSYGQPAYGQAQGQQGQGADVQQKTSPLKAATAGGLGKLLGWGMVASGLLAVIGCFGTWLYVNVNTGLGTFDVSTNGLGMVSSNAGGGSGDKDSMTDGWFILILALLVVVIGVLRGLGKLPKKRAFIATALSVIATGIALYDFSDASSKLDDVKKSSESLGNLSAGTGWGLGLCIFAGLAMIATSVVSALRD